MEKFAEAVLIPNHSLCKDYFVCESKVNNLNSGFKTF